MNLKKLFFSLLLPIVFSFSVRAQSVQIQVINNSADAALNSVDIYVNGVLFADDLDFRYATGFFSANTLAGNTVIIGVALNNSSNVADTFYSLTASVIPSNNYIMVVNGMKSTTGYTPYKKMNVAVFNNGKLMSSGVTNTEYAFGNGSTDFQTTDLRSGISIIAKDIPYGGFTTGYTNVPTSDFKIRTTNTNGGVTYGTYNAAFQNMGYGGVACMILTSGFVTPSANSNGPSFGLWVAPAIGGPLQQFSSVNPEAVSRFQLINNSADKLTDTVDVYFDNVLKYDNLVFRNATATIDMLATSSLTIGIAPPNSTSSADVFYTYPMSLDSQKRYVCVLNGIQSATGYTPKPPYALNVYNQAKETAASGNTGVLFMQGATDAPVIDIRYTTNTWFDDASYGSFGSGYATIPVNSYKYVNVTDATGATTYKSYDLPLTTMNLDGKTITLCESGFKTPSSNSNGPAWGLYVAVADGGPMIQLLESSTGISTVNANKLFRLYPNPAGDVLHIASTQNTKLTTADVIDITGRTVMNNVSVQNNELNISQLSNGIYILRFSYNAETVNLRFQKQ
ncbi:MAG: T9SS type A sorting domain-containing protein [Bacteroidetes bacterium]|nr:T9SS type A sorting domain-containing protein [Bacteroidota bacterium]